MSLYQLPKIYNSDSFSFYSFLVSSKEEHLLTYNHVKIAINEQKLLNKKAGTKLYADLFFTNQRILFLFDEIKDGFFIDLKDIEDCINIDQKEKLWKGDSGKQTVVLQLRNNGDGKAFDEIQSQYITHQWDCPVCFEHNFLEAKKDGEISPFICKLCGASITGEEELVNYSCSSEKTISSSSDNLKNLTCEKCTFVNDANNLNCKMCFSPLLLNKVRLKTFCDVDLLPKADASSIRIKLYYKPSAGNESKLQADVLDLISKEKLQRNMSKLNLSGENVAKTLINNIRQERMKYGLHRQQGIRTLISTKESKITELDVLLDTSLTDIDTFLSISDEIEVFFKEVGEFKNDYDLKNKISVKRSNYEVDNCLTDKWFIKDITKEFSDYLADNPLRVSSLNDLYVNYNFQRRRTTGFLSTKEFASIIREYKIKNKFSRYNIVTVEGVEYVVDKDLINEYINFVLEFLVKSLGTDGIDLPVLEKRIKLPNIKLDSSLSLIVLKLSIKKCIERGNVLVDNDSVASKCFYYYNHLL